MSILKDIHHTLNEENDLLEQTDSLMVELEEFLKDRFTIMEINYNASGEVEWDPEMAKPPGGGGGINTDTGAGLQRRRENVTPKVGDVLITSDETGRVVPAIVTSAEQNMGIVLNRKSNLKQKIDLTTLRQAQGDIAKRFAQKYPDKKFWQVNS